MKQVITIVALFSLLAFSCKKSHDDTIIIAKNNTWTLGSVTYTVNNYTKASDDFQAYDKAGNGMIFTFAPFPTADGNYNVVSNTSTLGAHDMKVVAFYNTSGTSYFADGSDHTVAAIKVLSPTLLSISLPDTWVVKGGTDSLKLSANIGSL